MKLARLKWSLAERTNIGPIIFATMLGFVLFGEIPDKYSFTGYVLIILASLGTFLYNMRVAKAGK